MKTKYILCDIEATGNRVDDAIIQIGMMVTDSLLYSKEVEIYSELNSSDRDMMYEAMEIHHITPEMLKGKAKLTQTDGYTKIKELNSSSNILIAHDAPSDISMLKREGIDIDMRVIDTLRCTKHLFGDLDAYRLQYLRYRLGLYRDEIEIADRLDIDIKPHEALSDVVVMKILLERLYLKLEEKYGYSSEDDIVKKLITLSSTPVKLERFSFGKYKGEHIDEIAHSDYRYLEWMYDNLKLDDDMRYTLELYL
ncbi:Exonuclease [hydrothermal vent metagenome]|uniref:Exonuclease n=1 Tax=hydrothermal vent metagenome TaxID=652676 RepID=A0A1W1BMD4_9ZZZZ